MSMEMYLFIHSVHYIIIWGRGARVFDFVSSLA
jgi:hypothetical protein